MEAGMNLKKIKKALAGILIIFLFPSVVNSFALYLFLEGELVHIHTIFGAIMIMVAIVYNFFFSSTAAKDFLVEGKNRQYKNIFFIKISYLITLVIPLLIIALLIFIFI